MRSLRGSGLNAYGAVIVSVERLRHPKGLTWNRVTWDAPNRQRYTANTLPGSTANRQVENHPEGVPATIILNGRSQVIFVEPFEPEQEDA
jgi:hypothetical protein